MPTSRRDHYIAGKLGPDDWQRRKKELSNDATLWAKTFEEFLMARLSLRYLKPIEIMQVEGAFQGEGFAIVSIQCAVLEFLAALKIGKNYKFQRRRVKLGEYEYSSSNKVFCDFLLNEEPFKKWFTTHQNARDFYANVRCALLHEARTKEGWLIWASGDVGVDPQKKLVSRDALQAAIMTYIESYGKLLVIDKKVQEAFIRKFDHLANP